MEVRVLNRGLAYAEVAEEAIERLRMPDDQRIPGVPNSINNIANQCVLFLPFGVTSNIAVLVRPHFESKVAIVVTRGNKNDSPYIPHSILSIDEDTSLTLGKIRTD